MRIGLRLAALAVLFVAIVLWLFGGAHRGLSRTSERVEIPDPVTGLTEVRWEKKTMPTLGVDFLAAAAAVASLLFGVSWFFRQIPNPNRNS